MPATRQNGLSLNSPGIPTSSLSTHLAVFVESIMRPTFRRRAHQSCHPRHIAFGSCMRRRRPALTCTCTRTCTRARFLSDILDSILLLPIRAPRRLMLKIGGLTLAQGFARFDVIAQFASDRRETARRWTGLGVESGGIAGRPGPRSGLGWRG